MSFEDFVRAFVACYFIFVALHYTARLSGLRARRGFPHAPVGPWRSANGLNQIVFRLFRAAILGLMTLRVFVPATDVFLGALPVLETDAVRAVGFVAMCAGLAVADHAHSYLADEWRSGTAARAADVLVTDGPYARSRNPIFTGVLIGQAGLFLAAPSLFTLACLAIGAAVILRQVGVEERTLAGRFGGRYAAYRARVPRWGAVGMAARGVTERR
ncbi:methyltransferase family protein [Oharaeibacter diazotrophicus]|uniref:Protein-S-isoprenylcysteine O-methyltransferase Ste14 n=1 Tax=Oharaeibacter diazotrophicus TaxID=1920512 RepID=A0A4R6RIP7_9HYPH|nr:isoprenylcysteine carboxylmethyltransferase family protein [Oharaeibacter diazotrophicus]TDP86300.1 protein-S-isoprenylcysteine O-methyltransferase Ste14 [Oharaeibacter diazotrophicus]BBE71757.1 hypothetical protein OHA_1_01340 [Pleomorphomonas sp. SM30]GLS78523.1 hypothetical protein GCM10007904_38600 [Oharaeibacter diazotrophicus]